MDDKEKEEDTEVKYKYLLDTYEQSALWMSNHAPDNVSETFVLMMKLIQEQALVSLAQSGTITAQSGTIQAQAETIKIQDETMVIINQGMEAQKDTLEMFKSIVTGVKTDMLKKYE
jgi:hypothetical protein